MDTRAALLWQQPGEWQVASVQLDGPSQGEVLVEMAAAGLCHSDDHAATGDSPLRVLPHCGGHEGSGIVRELGPGVTGLEVGDHIVTSFIPACGQCRWCASGMQQLCDNGALLGAGAQLDGSYRMHLNGENVSNGAMLGTFSEWQVLHQLSCIKITKQVPLEVACLVACGVPTGWGSAVNAAGVRPGDVVLVMGVGGVGINAVQGARHAGALHVIAVDPVPFKREMALKLGATEAFADMAEATEFARGCTNGQGCDSAIVTVGVIDGEHVAQAFAAIRKEGTVAVTALGSKSKTGIPVNLCELSMFQKRIQGVLYGCSSPRVQVPALLALYLSGVLKLDELVTRRYTLDQINDAYLDMREGRNIRGVICYGH
jgi:NDMA-dependent alcohol dehydrogenase